MDGGPVEVSEVAEYLDMSRQSIYNKVKKHGGYKIIEGYVEKMKKD